MASRSGVMIYSDRQLSWGANAAISALNGQEPAELRLGGRPPFEAQLFVAWHRGSCARS